MTFRLSPEDQQEYSRQCERLRTAIKVACANHDLVKAKQYRREMSALGDAYRQKALLEPAKLTADERIEALEQTVSGLISRIAYLERHG